MNQTWTIIVIISIWIISFVEPSGWALLLRLPEKFNEGFLILSIIYFIRYPYRRQNISTSLFWGIIITFVVIPFVKSGSWQGASYLVSFLVVYLVSQGTITSHVIKITGIALAALGLMTLFIYARGSLLSGWNDNAMSMIGLFSFLYYSIFLVLKKDSKKFWQWNIITLFYLQLLFSTDCRSGMLFSMIAVLALLFQHKVMNLVNKPYFIIVLLNIPLIIAFLVIWTSEAPFFHELNMWSYTQFDKPIFNGRDTLWNYALDKLNGSSYLGTGKFIINYHNSCIAALTVFGVMGYYFWIKYFKTNLVEIRHYLVDKIAFGSFLAFSLIYLQQSVDLGFIEPQPNLLPYLILGVGLGRVRYLKENSVLN